MAHITGDQVIGRLGGQGVDQAMADHVAEVASTMLDVQWATSPYPWDPDDVDPTAPSDVQEQALRVAVVLYDNAVAVAGTRQVTFEDVANTSQQLNSWTIIRQANVAMRWRSMKGLVG